MTNIFFRSFKWLSVFYYFFLHGQVTLTVLSLLLWSGGSYCLVIFWFCQENLDSKFVFVGHKAIGEVFLIVR